MTMPTPSACEEWMSDGTSNHPCILKAVWSVTTTGGTPPKSETKRVCGIHRRQLERLAKLNDKTFKQEPL